MNNTYESVLYFWFQETPQKSWWIKESAFDDTIKRRFEKLNNAALMGELSHWRETAQGALAEIILLDQFSRNIYRDTPRAFSSDSLSLCLAQEMVKKKMDLALPYQQRAFVYMPYMHSESKLVHLEAVKIFERYGNESNLNFELKHKEIIDRFGRYPHRNKILDRESSEEEIEFLKTPGSSF